jgi:hypothetical protein
LIDIINSSFNLGENILNNKIVRKIRELRLKVIVIEESNDLDSMKVEYFIESIQTYEIVLVSTIEENFGLI